jgi:hypothetical protein
MSPYAGTQFAMYRPAKYVSNAGKYPYSLTLVIMVRDAEADG